jgi:anti-sigma regulatory factor (Ser/Thr protein kinase)
VSRSPPANGSGRRTSIRIAGGPTAPRAARLAVTSLLRGRLGERQLADVRLIVSELVTNSVRHAGVGRDGAIVVDVLLVRNRIRLAVADPGSTLLPRVTESTEGGPRRLGLPLVEQLSSSWGVARDGSGVTRVWSELPLTA